MKKFVFYFSLLILILLPSAIFASGDLGMGSLGGSLVSTTYSGQSNISNPIGNIISGILALAGTIFLILIVYGGILWMTAAGNSEQVDKAKNVIIAAAIGGAITASAYSITYFVMLKLGENQTGNTDTELCCCLKSGGGCSYVEKRADRVTCETISNEFTTGGSSDCKK